MKLIFRQPVHLLHLEKWLSFHVSELSTKLPLLRRLGCKIVHLVQNYKEVVTSDLVFLLGGVCFEGLFVGFSKSAWSIGADPSEVLSQLPLTPQLASVRFSVHCGQADFGRAQENRLCATSYFIFCLICLDWLKSTYMQRLCWLSLKIPEQ